jgi:hypothetical protein
LFTADDLRAEEKMLDLFPGESSLIRRADQIWEDQTNSRNDEPQPLSMKRAHWSIPPK